MRSNFDRYITLLLLCVLSTALIFVATPRADAKSITFFGLSKYVRGLLTGLRSDVNSIRDDKTGALRSVQPGVISGMNISGNVLDFQGGGFGAGNVPQINFNQGSSKIYDDTNMHLSTDDYLYLDAPSSVVTSNDLKISGRLGIGTSPAHKLDVKEGVTQLWFQNSPSGGGSGRGLVLNKLDKTDPYSHTMEFAVEGNLFWAYGMDYDTNNATGRSDYVPVFDHTANGGTGADVFRVSAAADSTYGTGTKFVMGDVVGTPRNLTEFLLLNAGAGLSGMSIRFDDSAGTQSALALFNRSSTKARSMINWQNNWQVGTDYQNTNNPDFFFVDSAHSKTRIFVKSGNALNAQVGFGTTNPQAIVSAGGSSASSMYDVVQNYFIGSYSDSAINRSINIQQILDASSAKQYFFLNGSLGAGSTATTPVITSQFARGYGFESTDATLSIITSPSGTNQTITRALTIDNAGNVGINNTSPHSALDVPDGKYAQFEDNNAGAPPSGDCDSDTERGRMSVDTTNNRLYICNGASRGWDYTALTD